MSEVSSRPARRHRRLPGSMRHEHVHIEHMPFGASREIIEAFHMYSGETLSLQPGSWAGDACGSRVNRLLPRRRARVDVRPDSQRVADRAERKAGREPAAEAEPPEPASHRELAAVH